MNVAEEYCWAITGGAVKLRPIRLQRVTVAGLPCIYTSLTKQQFVATHTIRQTEIPAPAGSSVTTQLLSKSCVHKKKLLLLMLS